MKEKPLDRFLRKVHKTTTCWLWTGHRQKETKQGQNNYGRFFYKGANCLAHKVSYLLLKGEVLEGLTVRHTCDNPPCVNPEHLQLGTQQQNMQDMVTRGRQGSSSKTLRVKSLLSGEQATDIRKQCSQGTPQRILAVKYGVSQSTISHVVTGKRSNWRTLA